MEFKNIKNGKEILVAILFIIAAVLLYFGMNFLKGINIFSSTNNYVASFQNANGLVEQGNVYIKGYKVGQVDRIVYDFTKADPFTVEFSTKKDIRLPKGTIVAMVADGLLGGEALVLRLPDVATSEVYSNGDTLPSTIEAGVIDGIVNGLTSQLTPILESLNPIVVNLDSVVAVLKNNLTDEQVSAIVSSLNGTLANAEGITNKFDKMMGSSIPQLVDSIQLVVNDFREITDNLSGVDFKATILKLDTAVAGVNGVLDKCNSTDGTIGMLLNDRDLYININNTVSSADSLLVDLKANPKRYVHFSLIERKEKK